MQSCEVRQWQTFLQLRKKYVYIYIIWQYLAGQIPFRRKKHPRCCQSWRSCWRCALKAVFVLKKHIYFFNFHHISFLTVNKRSKVELFAPILSSGSQKSDGFARIRCDSAWSRKIHFSCFRTLRMEKPGKTTILLNTIGWNYHKIGYFTKEYGSFLHIPLSKQTEQILAGPLVTPVLSPDPSVVDTFLSASTHDPERKNACFFCENMRVDSKWMEVAVAHIMENQYENHVVEVFTPLKGLVKVARMTFCVIFLEHMGCQLQLFQRLAHG